MNKTFNFQELKIILSLIDAKISKLNTSLIQHELNEQDSKEKTLLIIKIQSDIKSYQNKILKYLQFYETKMKSNYLENKLFGKEFNETQKIYEQKFSIKRNIWIVYRL